MYEQNGHKKSTKEYPSKFIKHLQQKFTKYLKKMTAVTTKQKCVHSTFLKN